MEKAFELKYDATSEEAMAQVQAYLNHVGKRIELLNAYEENLMYSVKSLEFLINEAPKLENRLELLMRGIKDAIEDKRFNHPDDVRKDKLVDVVLWARDLLKSCANDFGDALQAVHMLNYARDNYNVEYYVKSSMLDECTRFQTKYWQFTETEHESH